MTEALAEKQSRPEPELGLSVNGAYLVPDPRGLLYWPDQQVLIAADMHFEKGSSYAMRGVALPPYDTRSTLNVLAEAVRRYAPKTIIALGDSFHDRNGADRLEETDREVIYTLTKCHHFVWITGNHDPAPPLELGGEVSDELSIGPLIFRHEPLALPQAGEIAGHLHPCAKLKSRGRMLRRRCFATDGFRLVMPSLGAYTGGLNVLDGAFSTLFQSNLVAWMLGQNHAYPIIAKFLVPDR